MTADDPGGSGRLPLPIDSLGMWEAAASLPEQLADAARVAQEVRLPDLGEVRHVVVAGMGASGLAGSVVAAATAGSLPVPCVVTSSYDLPAWVGPRTIAFALSWSGDTEETVSAASAAVAAGATLVAVTGGGELAALAERAGATVVPVPAGIPQSRAALGAVSAPPLVLLGRMGLVEDQRPRLAAAVDQLFRRRDQLVSHLSPARDVARRIGRTFPLVHGSPGLAGVAARRWKAQVNGNAKSPAFWSAQPGLCHDELAGWGQSGDVTRQILTLVTLRRQNEHPRVARRFDTVTELLREVVGDVVEVWAEGQGELAHFFDLAIFGDMVSLNLAGREGLDPGPVPALTDLKRQLATTAG